MGPALHKYFPGSAPGREPPPLFTARTVLPLPGALAAAIVLFVVHRSAALAFAAIATVYAAQLLAPLVRRYAFRTEGAVSEVLFVLPFGIFFAGYAAWIVRYPVAWRWSWGGVCAGIAAAAALRAAEWPALSTMFDRDLLGLIPPIRITIVVLESYMLLGSAVFQELFYRGVLFQLLGPIIGAWTIAVTTAAFTVEHLANRWAATLHSPAYYIRMTVFSAFLGGMIWVTRSLAAALVAHVLYNSLNVTNLVYRYRINPYRTDSPVTNGEFAMEER
jgi:membrane protease YdiL (CAAX protease family)